MHVYSLCLEETGTLLGESTLHALYKAAVNRGHLEFPTELMAKGTKP